MHAFKSFTETIFGETDTYVDTILCFYIWSKNNEKLL